MVIRKKKQCQQTLVSISMNVKIVKKCSNQNKAIVASIALMVQYLALQFKKVGKVHVVGSRWLLAGVRTSGCPFSMGIVRCGVVDYTIRLFWLELSFSELPF